MKSMGLQRSVEVGGQFPPEMGSVDSFWSYQIPIVATLILSLAVTTVSSIGLSVGWDTYHLLNETNSTLHKKMAALGAMQSPTVTESKDFTTYTLTCELSSDVTKVTTSTPGGDQSVYFAYAVSGSPAGLSAITATPPEGVASMDLCESTNHQKLVAESKTTATFPTDFSSDPSFATAPVKYGSLRSMYHAYLTQTHAMHRATGVTITTKTIRGMMSPKTTAGPLFHYYTSDNSMASYPLPVDTTVGKTLKIGTTTPMQTMTSLFTTVSTVDVVSTVDY